MRHARARRRPFETIGVAITALVLAAVPAAVVSTSTSAVAADTTLVSTDFTDGTIGAWTQSGGPTLSVVDVEGNPALQVADRTQDFDGIQTPAGFFADVEPGAELTLSMRARLAPGTVGPADVRLVVKPAYGWVGNTTMTADAWTTVTGTYTVPADADPAELQVYVGTGALDAPVHVPARRPGHHDPRRSRRGRRDHHGRLHGRHRRRLDPERRPDAVGGRRRGRQRAAGGRPHAGLRRGPDARRPVRGRRTRYRADPVDAGAARSRHGRARPAYASS